jgi:transposase
MTDGTQMQNSATTGVLYMALELSATEWLVAFSDGSVSKPRRVKVDAGELGQLNRAMVEAKEKLKLPAEAKTVSCYEAGRDGFWIDRALRKAGIENHVVEASSIEVTRKFRRVKTDGIDVDILLRMLVRFKNGEERVWRTLRVPSEGEEDARRRNRERDRLKKEIVGLRNRIGGLLATQGLKTEPEDVKTFVETAKTRDGRDLGPNLKEELVRMHERLMLDMKQLDHLEKQQRTQLAQQHDDRHAGMIAQLMCLHGLGMQGATPLVNEFFAWRDFKNRREVGALAGLTGTPYNSGSSQRDQGISKAGNKRIRHLAVELAWLWVRHQPDSAISLWFAKRWGDAGKRSKKVGIVAVARKLLVALWHFLEHGAIPTGATLKPSPGVKKATLAQVRERHDARNAMQVEGDDARVVPPAQLMTA